MTAAEPIKPLTMARARKWFARNRKIAPGLMTDGGFRSWARMSNLPGTVGKLRRIVVGTGRRR